jgi:hypothetical protein
VKRSGLGAGRYLLEAGASDTASARFVIRFSSDNTLLVTRGQNADRITSQVFRDVSAWCHLVVTVDTTQATANDRIKVYINGAQVTVFSSISNPAQNDDLGVNAAAVHAIGRSNVDSGDYFSGYLADVYLLDGIAADPSSFTTTDLTTGQLVPKAFTGSYGTNGFKLNFSSNATTAALGTDTSGNGNTWTVNNFSITAGSGNDSLVDTPTSYGTSTGVGGEVRGNYATWNPLNTKGTLTNGNLDGATGTTDPRSLATTLAVFSGKWYAELTCSSTSVDCSIGVSLSTFPVSSSSRNYSFDDGVAYIANGSKYVNGSSSSYGASYATNDVIGIAIDFDNNQITFYKNGTSQGPISKTLLGSYVISVTGGNSGVSETVILNAGQRAFSYTAPSGFRPFTDTLLPAPVVAKPSTVFDTKLYTGNGSTQTISGLGFEPDLIWIKGRSINQGNSLYDAIRGFNKKVLSSDSTSAEVTETGGLNGVTSTGFTLDGNNTIIGGTNGSGSTYAAWCWDAGTTTVSNTQGSITSQVRANASAGFSVVTYTGNGTSGATFGHGLNSPLGMVVIKQRGNSGTPWDVWHSGYYVAGSKNYIRLNYTDAAGYASDLFGTPTSTLVTLGSSNSQNLNSGTYVAYCWAPVSGYSSFGSYVGNGSTDGPFVFTGFRPKFLLLKANASGYNWQIRDSARATYNAVTNNLNPNLSDAETSGAAYGLDFLSNGFKITSTGGEHNLSGTTILYAAFAESPLQYSRAR